MRKDARHLVTLAVLVPLLAGGASRLPAQLASQDGVLVALARGEPPARWSAALAALDAPGADDIAPRWVLPAALRSATVLGFERAATGPALTATAEDLDLRLLVARAARDTALVRLLLREADAALARVGPRCAPPPVLLAETEAWLGDSAAALARLAAFMARAGDMDSAVSWGGVRNGWLLERAASLLAGLRGRRFSDNAEPRLQSDGQPVILPVATPGRTTRYRYDVALWTPVGARPTAGPAAPPTARLAVVMDESAAPDESGIAVTRQVRAAALDVPLLLRLGDEGLAYLRGVLEALDRSSATALLDERQRVVASTTSGGGDGAPARVARQMLGALGPLGALPALPAGPIRTGDTWTDTVDVSVPGALLDGATVRVPVALRLEEVRLGGEGRYALIALDGSADTPATGAVARTTVTLTGEVLLDLEDGLVERTAVSVRAGPVRLLVTALRQR